MAGALVCWANWSELGTLLADFHTALRSTVDRLLRAQQHSQGPKPDPPKASQTVGTGWPHIARWNVGTCPKDPSSKGSACGSAAPGHDPHQAGKPPADQRVDGDSDQGLGFKDIAAAGRRVEDTMERRDEHLSEVVDERDEACLGRSAKQLEQEANDEKRVDYSRNQPDRLLRPHTVGRSNRRHLRRRAVFACSLHTDVTGNPVQPCPIWANGLG